MRENHLNIYLILKPNAEDILRTENNWLARLTESVILKVNHCVGFCLKTFIWLTCSSLRAETWSSVFFLTSYPCCTVSWLSVDAFEWVGCWAYFWEMVNVFECGLTCKMSMALIHLSKNLLCAQHMCSLWKKLYKWCMFPASTFFSHTWILRFEIPLIKPTEKL